MKESVAGVAGLVLVAFALFGGVHDSMSAWTGIIGLILCLSVAR